MNKDVKGHWLQPVIEGIQSGGVDYWLNNEAKEELFTGTVLEEPLEELKNQRTRVMNLIDDILQSEVNTTIAELESASLGKKSDISSQNNKHKYFKEEL